MVKIMGKTIPKKRIFKPHTAAGLLTQKKRSTNRSGYKGVTVKKRSSGKLAYRAELTVAGKRYSGPYQLTAKRAYQDRLNLEQIYQKPVLEKLQQTGMKMSRNNKFKYTNKELIKLIQHRAKELGRQPKYLEFRNRVAAVNRFGTWTKFLKAAGFGSEVTKKITTLDLFEALRKFEYENNRLPLFKEFKYSQTAYRRFGSWHKFLNAYKKDKRKNQNLYPKKK